MSTKRFVCIGLLLLSSASSVWAQVTQYGTMPSLNLNKKLARDWSLNLKWESRQIQGAETRDWRYQLSDLAFAVGKKTSIEASAALGLLLRIEGDERIYRSFQQWTKVKRYPRFKLSHRLMTDQTFRTDIEYRLRYRASAEIPLQGQSLDAQEYFLKLSNEYVNAWEARNYDLEIRMLGFLGYAFNSKSKLELGLDYRREGFLNQSDRQRIWTGVNWYLSF